MEFVIVIRGSIVSNGGLVSIVIIVSAVRSASIVLFYVG